MLSETQSLPFDFLLRRLLDFHTKKTNIPTATATVVTDPTTAPTIIPVAPWKYAEKNNT